MKGNNRQLKGLNDSLVRKGLDQIFTGSEAATASPKILMRVWMSQKHIKIGNKLMGYNHCRLLPVQPSREIAKEVLKFNRNLRR